MAATRVPIVGKQEPYAAIRTSPDPIMLGPGEFALGENLRAKGGVPTIRNGMDRVINLNNSAFTSENIYGAWIGNIGGDTRRIAAVSGSPLFTAIYDLDSGAEITASSGKYGNTRLTRANETQYWVQFEQVIDQLGETVCVIACNGTDAPRVLTHDGSGWTCAIHQEIPIPEEGQDLGFDAVPYYYLNIRDYPVDYGYLADTGTTIQADNTKYEPIGTAHAVKVTAQTTVQENDSAWIYLSGSAIDMSLTRQLWMVIDTADPSWLNNWAVSLGDDVATPGTEVFLWDPRVNDYPEPIIIPIDATSKYLVLFNYTEDTALQLDAIKSVVWTWADGDPPDDDSPFWVLAIAWGGSELGGTQWAFTRKNSGSKAESPGLVLSKQRSIAVYDIGGPRDGSTSIPCLPEMLVNYKLRLINPTTDQMSDGIDTINLYSRMWGQDRFYLTKVVTAATYTSSVWNVVSGYDGSTVTTTIGDLSSAVYPTQKQVVMPDSFTRCIPVDCVAPAYSSGRLVVASAGSGSGYERYDTVWVSDQYYPFRFRKAPSFSGGAPVEESGFTIAMSGESVREIMPSSTGGLVGGLFYIGTDSSVYVMPGVKTSQMLQISRISPYGISHHGAIAEHNGMLAWHSTNNQVYIMRGGRVDEISYLRVDDRLDPITVAPYGELTPVIAMAFRDEKLYIGYRYTGTSLYHCDRCLVYDLRLEDWVSDDVMQLEAQFRMLLTGVGGVGELVLYSFGLYGTKVKVYEYDSPGLTTDETDAGGQNIAWKIRRRPIIMGLDGSRLTVGRVFVFCTKQNSGTITITRGYRPSGVTASSSINTAATQSELHRVDGAITPSAAVEHWGATAYVELSGSSPGGFQIFNAFAEVESRGDSADSNP